MSHMFVVSYQHMLIAGILAKKVLFELQINFNKT